MDERTSKNGERVNRRGERADVVRPVAEVAQWRGLVSPNLWRAFRYLQGHGRLLVIIGLFALLYLPFAFIEPFLVKFLVDRIMLNHEPQLLVRLTAAMVVFFAVYGVIEYLSMYFVLKLGQRLHAAIKSEQLANLLGKGLNFHKNTACGRLIYCFFNDSNQIGSLLSLGLATTVLNVLFIVLRAAILWYIAPQLLAIYAVMLPIQAIVMYRVMKRMMRYQIELKGMDEELTSRIESMLMGAVAVKGFGFGSAMQNVWDRVFSKRLALDLRAMLWQRGGFLLVGQIQIIASFLILFYGVYLVDAVVMTLGDLLAFLAVAGRLTPSVHGIIAFFVSVQETLVGVERYYKVFDLPDEETEFGRERDRTPGARVHDLDDQRLQAIEVRNVQVDHGGVRVDIPCHFQIMGGKRYIWHGPNGAGKTSVGLALAGLIPHARGSIRCGGLPLTDFSLATVRRQVLYVGGEPFWPERSLAETFTNSAGNGHLDHSRLAHALDLSEAQGIVESLPLGLDTVFDGSARALSQGENQRLFLAVALYRRPALLILDEILSHVPAAQRKRILDRLGSVSPETTLIYITNTAEHLDRFDGEVRFRPRVLALR